MSIVPGLWFARSVLFDKLGANIKAGGGIMSVWFQELAHLIVLIDPEYARDEEHALHDCRRFPT